MDWRIGGSILLILATAGCDRLAARAPNARPEAAAAAPQDPMPDLAAYVGRPYAALVDEHEARFNPNALGVTARDRARLWRAMASSSGAMMEGGGAEALVFRGCAETGCADGVGVVAVDAQSGTVFVGVRDAGGTHVLVPNDQLEALLRLDAPTRHWADVTAPHQSAEAAPTSARP